MILVCAPLWRRRPAGGLHCEMSGENRRRDAGATKSARPLSGEVTRNGGGGSVRSSATEFYASKC
jgi:hypothetical protein